MADMFILSDHLLQLETGTVVRVDAITSIRVTSRNEILVHLSSAHTITLGRYMSGEATEEAFDRLMHLYVNALAGS